MKYGSLIRKVLAVLGVVIVYCSFSTSDFYTLELSAREPASVWVWAAIGCVMLIPTFVHWVREDFIED